jgi:hypothetical protein
MDSLDQFASADLTASKVMVQRYLERGYVRPALARLQLCLSVGSTDDEVLELLAQAFEKLGKQDKADFVYDMLARRRRHSEAFDDQDPTSLYIDMSCFDDRSPWDDVPTDEWKRRGNDYVRVGESGVHSSVSDRRA